MSAAEAQLDAMIAELSRATCLELLAQWELPDTASEDRLRRTVCMAYKMGKL